MSNHLNTTTSSIADKTCAAPAPSASIAPASCDTEYLDSHTIPVIFGTIGVILACPSLVVNVAFGLLPLRALGHHRNRDEIEVGKPGGSEPAAAGVGSKATVDAVRRIRFCVLSPLRLMLLPVVASSHGDTPTMY